MFIIKKVNKKSILVFALLLLLIIFVVLRAALCGNPESYAYCEGIGKCRTEISDKFSAEDFCSQFGLSIDLSSETKEYITIPSEFNGVYEKYNSMQIQQGFNLEGYKGRKAERRTYDVKNAVTASELKVNLIIYDSRVIAGDLCTVSLDGAMTTLFDKTMIKGEEHE